MTAQGDGTQIVGTSLHGAALITLAVAIGVAKIGGAVAGRLGQAQVVGELIVGIMLGPSLLGLFAPSVFAVLFRHDAQVMIGVLSQIGLIFVGLQIGLDFESSHLRTGSGRRSLLVVAVTGIVGSFAIGCMLGVASAGLLPPHVDLWAYALFIGTALSITALPVLGLIIEEIGLTGSAIATFGLGAAAVSDVCGWILLSLVSAFAATSFKLLPFVGRIVVTLLIAGIAWYAARKLMLYVAERAPERSFSPATLLAGLLAVTFLSAALADQVGLSPAFAAFAVGVMLSGERRIADLWREKTGDVTAVLFLPAYFTYTGLRTDIHALVGPEWLAWFCVILLGATAGKFGLTYVCARLCKFPARESLALGTMMNTKGLVELIVLNVGLDLGIVPRPVYSILVVVAIVSTAITLPLLRRCYPKARAGVRTAA